MLLRPFTPEDWRILAQYWLRDMPESEIKAVIAKWNTNSYDGRYYEQLAVDVGGSVVGCVSLLARSDAAFTEGVEIFPPHRSQGFGYAAVKALLLYGKAMGYQTACVQIRVDNSASLALHKKLGFLVTDSFVNRRGNRVYELQLQLT